MGSECPICKFPLSDAATDAPPFGTVVSHDTAIAACPHCGADLQMTEATEIHAAGTGLVGPAPTRVAHFALLELLGQGSFGAVWLAEDLHLGRRVALKLPTAHRRDAASLVHEAKTAAQLRHPNIVSIFEVGREDGQIFIASEYVAGMDLRDYLSKQQPSFRRTAGLVREIAMGLHHAHQHGIVHCDVKPANILISSDGQPFVTDFGLAKHLADEVSESSEGRVFGTADYMSPEQASGKFRETDRRADIYAVGVMLFEMFTGERPYRGTRRAVLHQKMFEDAPSPRKLQPHLPRDLETICLKCLEREPHKRYATALDVAEELDRFFRGEPIKARPVSALEHGWRWCRRRPAVAGLGAALIGSLIFGLISVGFFWSEAAKRTEQTRQSLYRSEMHLLGVRMQQGDVAAIRNSLARFHDPDLADLRGFEWHYYQTETAPFAQLVAHGDVVRDVAISRDADWFASAGFDRAIRIWDARSGALLGERWLDVGRWESIAISPTDDRLVAGASDGMLRIWTSLQDDQPQRVIKHGPPVAQVRISGDGKYLASAGESGAARLWDLDSGELLQEFPSGKQGVADLRFTPDAEHLAVASNDGKIRFWKLADRQVTVQCESPLRIESLALSDDGKLFALGSYSGKVEFRSAADGQLLYSVETLLGTIGDLQFLRNSATLAIPTIAGKLIFHDTQRRQEIRTLHTHASSAGVVAAAANGRYLALGSGDGSVKLLDLRPLRRPDVLWHRTHVRELAFVPGGDSLVVADGDGAVDLLKLDGSPSIPLAPGGGRDAVSLAVQVPGHLIAFAQDAAVLSVWDRRVQHTIRQFDLPTSGVTAIEFSPSGRWLAAAGRRGTVCVYDTLDWQSLQWDPAAKENRVQAIAFSPDDASIAVAYEDGEIHFFNTLTGKPAGNRIAYPAAPSALAYCDQGRVLAVATLAGDVYRYEVRTQRDRSVIRAHPGGVHDLAAFPDGTALVSAGRDGSLRVWDVATGEPRAALPGHRRRVFCLDISPNGRVIASAGLEGDIRIWSGE